MNQRLTWILCAALLAGCAQTTQKASETAFFPPLPQPPKLQYLTSISTEKDIGGEASSGLQDWLVGQRRATKQIARAQDIGAVKGKIYVLDRTFKKVLVVDLVKKTLDFLKDEREGALADPMGLWVTPDDYKYVVDATRKQVLAYDPANKFVRAYGSKGQFERPMDVAVAGKRMYVVDFVSSSLVVLDLDSGNTVQTIGEPGQENGQFNRPTHVTVDRKGFVYVNDSFNYRIQKFDAKGKHIKNYGYQGDTLGGFARPKGVAVDDAGLIYVVDAAFENTQIFDPESTDLLLFFGGYGPHAGSMYLPSSLHIDYENLDFFQRYVDKDFKIKYLVLVGNLLGDKKLNVYGFGDWIGAPLPVVERRPVFAVPAEPKDSGAAKK
ncbi:MAG: 6-bladed beta-propeller [Rubrivivax sp.]|nr:6-bladed beta-propeller [Rubrivivax sp.]